MEVFVAPHPLVERCRRRSCIIPCIVRGHVKQIIATASGYHVPETDSAESRGSP
jgi:hypothetical protein